MDQILSLAGQNLLSPVILCFVLGLSAALARSDLTFPEAIAKGMSLYLLFAIGFKGGASVAEHGADLRLGMAVLVGVVLSFLLPFAAYLLLRSLARGVSATDAAAVAGHYGSISIVTFVAASTLLQARGITFEGYMVAVAAAMEAPAIVSALWLATRGGSGTKITPDLWREIMLNGSIVLLLGAFTIGWITGERGLAEIAPLIVAPFKGVLCLFLLDMGIVAGRGLRNARGVISAGVIAFGLLMPLVGASVGALAGLLLGLSAGGVTLMMVLAASASYIAVPAAMRVALPKANPALYLTLALAITFPFNLTLGIPLYMAVASALAGG
ncbi:MAG: sodium-dependent bicarbonate transport family permease [Pararhodobacter sp.]|nr:sodium-dependent bicarbonate transport family permease [Pararhodobacter sp.]